MQCPCLQDLPPPPTGKTGWPWTEGSSELPEQSPASALKISIITPSFNQGQFLEETIRSVLLQGYPDLEYIIMDGGSTDNSVEIIRKYEPWITFWESRKDNGQSSAINAGWRKATGDIISYLNSDDTLTKDALSVVADRFQEEDNPGMVFGDAVFIEKNSAPLAWFRGKQFRRSDLFFRLLNIGQPAAFYRRAVLAETGYLDETLQFSMDFDLWLRISVHHLIVYIPSVLATMRIHTGAKTVQAFLLFYQDELTSLKSLFQQPDIPESLKNIEEQAYSCCYLRGGYRAFQLGDMTEARRLLLTALRMNIRFLVNPVHYCIVLLTFFPPSWVRKSYRVKAYLFQKKNFIDLLLESAE